MATLFLSCSKETITTFDKKNSAWIFFSVEITCYEKRSVLKENCKREAAGLQPFEEFYCYDYGYDCDFFFIHFF